MKIKKTFLNNHKKSIVIVTAKGTLELPISKLDLQPTEDNRIVNIYVDPELGKEAVTYELQSGDLDSVHLDVFLDFNHDPGYLRMLFLFDLSIQAQKEMKTSGLSKNEVCRRLKTSPSQLARLLDQTNHKKSVDKMLDLLAVLGVSVKPVFGTKRVA